MTGRRRADFGGAAGAWLVACALVVLLLGTWACYQGGLGGPLLLDDGPQLQPILQALDAGNWRTRAADFLFNASGPGGRPLAMASLMLGIVAYGGDIASLKLENVLLHLLCGVVLFAWLRALQVAVRGPSHSTQPSPWPALFCTGLWLLHPLQVSTVLYTVQRMTVLSALFTLAGLLFYTLGRNAQQAEAVGQVLALQPGAPSGGRPDGGDVTATRAPASVASVSVAHAAGSSHRGAVLIALAFAVWLPLAALSKENGVLLLPLCALLEVQLFRRAGSLRQRRILHALYGLVLVLPLVLAATVLAPRIAAVLQWGYALRNFTLGERLLTELRVLVMYLGEWLLPLQSNLPFYHDELQASHGILSPWTTAASAVLLAVLTVLALGARRRLPLLTLGWGVFLIGHSLEGSVVPLELAFEHRNYLPSVGLALLPMALPWRMLVLAALRARFGVRWPPRRAARALTALAVLVLLVCAQLTAARSDTWGDASRLFPALYAANPNSPRLAALFANSYANAGQFDRAREALGRQDTVGARLQGLDLDCLARVPLEPARLAAVLAGVDGVMAGYEVEEIVHLANDALEQRCGLPLPWGVAVIDRALRLPINQASSRQLLWLYRAHLHHALQDSPQAQQDLAQSAQADPDNPLPLLLACDWALDQGDRLRAQASFDGALRVTGRHREEYADLYARLARRLKEHRS